MTIGSEYRLQTMLGLLQILTCVFTMILAGSLGKLMEFISLPNSQPSAFISFVRGGGFLFILSLPILWAIFTIKKREKHCQQLEWKAYSHQWNPSHYPNRSLHSNNHQLREILQKTAHKHARHREPF